MKNLAEKLNAKNLALAAAVVWGLTIFGTTLLSVAAGYGTAFLVSYGSLHPGYSISIAGAFIGFIYAFACAFAGIYAFAWLYNRLGARKR